MPEIALVLHPFPGDAGDMELRRKRAYDSATADDGFRVLIDRLWPRGVSKERAAIDLWAKGIAPSAELRHDWHAAPDSDWNTFADRYRAELKGDDSEALRDLVEVVRQHPVVTLVYSWHDPDLNHAVVLEEAITALL